MVKDIQYRISDDYKPNQQSKVANMISTNYVRKPDECIALVDLHIELGSGDSENPPFYLSLSIVAEFYWEEGCDEDTVNALLKQNASALLLSYARPVISNITSNSIMPYDIPFIDFTKNENG